MCYLHDDIDHSKRRKIAYCLARLNLRLRLWMMSMIHPNVETPMIKMMMRERMPPTTEADSLVSFSHEAG